MALYLVDKHYAELAIDMINRDPNATVILVQDGVYLDTSKIASGKEIYCLDRDVEKRNLEHLPLGVMKISDEEIIDLMLIEAVYSFI